MLYLAFLLFVVWILRNNFLQKQEIHSQHLGYREERVQLFESNEDIISFFHDIMLQKKECDGRILKRTIGGEHRGCQLQQTVENPHR